MRSLKNITLFFCVVFVFESMIYAMYVDQVQNKLSDNAPYEFFDILSEDEIAAFAEMIVKADKFEGVHYFTKKSQGREVEGFLQNIENADRVKDMIMPIVGNIYQRIVRKQQEMIPDTNIMHFACIIVENELSSVDVGWHVDNAIQRCNLTEDETEKASHRIIVPLLGKGTIFAKNSADDQFLKMFCQDYTCNNPEVIKAVHAMIKPEDCDYLEVGQAVMLDRGRAVHMRPLTKQPRVLMIVDFEKKRWKLW